MKITVRTLEASVQTLVDNKGMSEGQAKAHIAAWMLLTEDDIDLKDSDADIANYLSDRTLQ